MGLDATGVYVPDYWMASYESYNSEEEDVKEKAQVEEDSPP